MIRSSWLYLVGCLLNLLLFDVIRVVGVEGSLGILKDTIVDLNTKSFVFFFVKLDKELTSVDSCFAT